VRTIAGEVRDSRTRSSIDTGVGPSRPMMRARSSSSGSTSSGNVTLGLLHWQIEAAAEDRFQHRDHVGRMRAGAEAPPRRASAGRASSGARRHNH
jgi:hypothetical protein